MENKKKIKILLVMMATITIILSTTIISMAFSEVSGIVGDIAVVAPNEAQNNGIVSDPNAGEAINVDTNNGGTLDQTVDGTPTLDPNNDAVFDQNAGEAPAADMNNGGTVNQMVDGAPTSDPNNGVVFDQNASEAINVDTNNGGTLDQTVDGTPTLDQNNGVEFDPNAGVSPTLGPNNGGVFDQMVKESPTLGPNNGGAIYQTSSKFSFRGQNNGLDFNQTDNSGYLRREDGIGGVDNSATGTPVVPFEGIGIENLRKNSGVQSANPLTPTPPPNTIVVKNSSLVDSFEGWGTSLAWFANITGGWEKTREALANALFRNDESGLGLNIVRYNIGAGYDPASDKYNVKWRIGASVEGWFFNNGKVVNPNTDWNQRWWLFKARDIVPSENFITEAFCNSPRYDLTKSGVPSGNDAEGTVENLAEAAEKLENVKPEKLNDFSQNIVDVLKFMSENAPTGYNFKDKAGLSFNTISPFNEPLSAWWKLNKTGMNQEGTHFSIASQRKVIVDLWKKLNAANLSTGIVGGETSDINEAQYAIDAYAGILENGQKGQNLLPLLTRINVHAYPFSSLFHGIDSSQSGKDRVGLNNKMVSINKDLYMSEFGSGGGKPNMDASMELGETICRDLNIMKAKAWVYWQVIEDYDAEGWGLLNCALKNNQDGSPIRVNKTFDAFKNFTRYIAPGAQIMDFTLQNPDQNLKNVDPKTFNVVSANPQNGTFSVICVNKTGLKINYNIDLSNVVGSDNLSDYDVSLISTCQDEKMQELQKSEDAKWSSEALPAYPEEANTALSNLSMYKPNISKLPAKDISGKYIKVTIPTKSIVTVYITPKTIGEPTELQ